MHSDSYDPKAKVARPAAPVNWLHLVFAFSFGFWAAMFLLKGFYKADAMEVRCSSAEDANGPGPKPAAECPKCPQCASAASAAAAVAPAAAASAVAATSTTACACEDLRRRHEFVSVRSKWQVSWRRCRPPPPLPLTPPP